jgi:hypothetical protein
MGTSFERGAAAEGIGLGRRSNRVSAVYPSTNVVQRRFVPGMNHS